LLEFCIEKSESVAKGVQKDKNEYLSYIFPRRMKKSDQIRPKIYKLVYGQLKGVPFDALWNLE
jgi:hypothetical protein